MRWLYRGRYDDDCAVCCHMRAARLPQLLVADDLAAGRLIMWGAATDRPSELWALHTSRRLPSAKVKAFINFLETAFRKTL